MLIDPFLCPSGQSFLAGGATAGQAIRSFDWRTTPLGAPAGWSESLKTLVSILLASNQPMFVAWGPQRSLLYNEAYASILGAKHPQAMGRDFLDVWFEIRNDLLPMVEKVYCGESVRMDDVGALAAEKFHQLRLHRPGEKLYVSGDSARLVQTVTNLLHNAIKYTDPHSTITLAVSSTEEKLVLAVQDTGIGISAELLPHIFDLFVQSERSLDRSQGGLGIGLSVARRLVGCTTGPCRPTVPVSDRALLLRYDSPEFQPPTLWQRPPR